ncbi:MAG: hypothetical protein COB17_01145 [Sulfurimonas sp.]|nr:MAG: hypothetical protein COB17_01145 [Sulfurimonas sp.]
MFDDDFLTFVDSKQEEKKSSLKYKVLIVDDEESVHAVTKLVLGSMSFQGRSLEMFHAYSAKEGEEKLVEIDDIAVILLDVVMETDTAGLDLVKIIRDKLKNKIVRIILRTGQPGQAPEEEVIVNYDINDYKNKSELTTEKLFSSIVTALRSYSDIIKIERNKISLEKVLASTSFIINLHSLDTFFSGLMEQIVSLTNNECSLKSNCVSVYMSFYKDNKLTFNTGTGIFKEKSKRTNLFDTKYKEVVSQTLNKRENIKTDEYYTVYHHNEDNTALLMLFEGDINSINIEDNLLNIFVKNMAITYDNLIMSNDIKESQKDTIFMLSEMAEQRSREMGKHVKRVAYFAKEIGEELGLSKNEVEELFIAAPMHDIGKIAIADRILKKPGKLDYDEFEIMKLHSQKGYDLLKNSEKRLMRTAAVVAHEHHERFDGHGYPQGLSGDKIHIYAKITAICDVFDALSSKRVYKEAWPLDKVLNLIKSEKGKQFDPKVVDAFLARLGTILEILEEYKDNISDEAFIFEE